MIDEIIKGISQYVRNKLIDAEAGHDWWHIARVWHNARYIAQQEKGVDMVVVELAALLHDIADSKFHDGNEEIGPETAHLIMTEKGVDKKSIEHVINIIRHLSYKNSLGTVAWTSAELRIVQDADRLDAIGAVGIARAFSYGGYKGRSFFDPEMPPKINMTKEEYKNNQGPTINHFYEKLLRLKGLMHTETAKSMAEKRHEYMVSYLDAFYEEIGHTPSWHKDF